MHVHTASPPAPTRLLVIGGGPSAMAAVYYLTSTEELRARYEVTVLQMGWRLGGKAASGRGEGGRIEEHGLHILFGFYDNFFALIRRCWADLTEEERASLPTVEDAFEPHHFGVVGDPCPKTGEWQPWFMHFPPNGARPGLGDALPTWGEMVNTVVGILTGFALPPDRAPRAEPAGLGGCTDADYLHPPVARVMRIIQTALRPTSGSWSPRRSSLEGLRRTAWHLLGPLAKRRLEVRQFRHVVDFALTGLIGMLADDVLRRGGFRSIDHLDFRGWLRRNGARQQTLDCFLVRSVYDAAFSFEDGDTDRPSVAAGAAIHALMRMICTYKGAVYYKMRAGMGDVVFTPLYRVLRRRGVLFKFFHRVEALRLSTDGRRVAAVEVSRQAHPQGDYDPLIDIDGMGCWPSEPLWDQLEGGDSLRGQNLETYYDLPETADRITLALGEDFDQVLFGAPVACIPWLCEELLAASPRWRKMVQQVRSVQTQSLQLWFTQTLPELGWSHPPPLLSLYTPPLNTWSDMSQTLWAEPYSRESVHSISYFTGPQKGPTEAPHHTADPEFPDRMNADTRSTVLHFLDQEIGGLLPNAVDEGGGFDWNTVYDPKDRRGSARFEAQLSTSNSEPWERCTVAFPGSTQHRMAPGDTGFDNLFVTGDWTDNRMYLACVEGAVISGVLATRAITGLPFRLYGDALTELWD